MKKKKKFIQDRERKKTTVVKQTTIKTKNKVLNKGFREKL